MRRLICLALLAGLAGCNSGHEKPGNPEGYMLVDAKVKVYHEDGSRSYEDYRAFPSRTVDLLPAYGPREEAQPLTKYGGLIEKKSSATGFFRVEKIDGRWWGIDPSGSLYVNMAVNSINTGKSERSRKALEERFGSKEKWMEESAALLHNNGFNCAGSWSDVEAIRDYNEKHEIPLAYTVNWNFMSRYGKERGGTYQQPGHTGYPGDAIFVFDPEFESFCDRHAQQLVSMKDDHNLFGHFSDNEMPFKFSALDDYLALPEEDHGHRAAVDWLKSNKIEVGQINDEHREAFMAFVGDRYFSIVGRAIRKYDPNHMYIGSRFYGNEKHHEAFMKAAGKHLDIISNNYYNHWTPDSAHMAQWISWTEKPFLITEYYTKGEDSGMGNQSGAGWIVRTQKDRGLFYQNYNLALLESGSCVGWHYFKYQDNDPTAKGMDPSNLDANKGIVTYLYEPWTDMLEEMAELNFQVYDLIQYFDNDKP